MELRIFSRDLEPLGIVDETISVIWKPSYSHRLQIIIIAY